jgi:NAD(P)H-dependent FMN reductase
VIRVAIVLGSTRPGRRGEAVARWVLEHAAQRADAAFEIVDVADFALPLLDEPMPPMAVAMRGGEYTKPHTRKWSETIASFDGFVFVTPEYNHSMPAALKNAIDFLYKEWNDKAAGFVSYGGGANGTRAVTALRLVMAEVRVADVRAQLGLNMHADWEGYTAFKPGPQHAKQLTAMLDEVVAWSGALKPLRSRG